MTYRVLHYINQYFGGLGGEEAANLPLQVREGVVGPGRALQQALGDAATITTTLIGGDNWVNDNQEAASAALTKAIKEIAPDVVVAGPAFVAGRYGIACGLVAKLAQEAGVPAVAAMSVENPGADTYRREVLIASTGSNLTQMQAAVASAARLALKLAAKEALGPADEEGYIPQGIRKSGVREVPGYVRGVDMLVTKLKGQPFKTELPVELPEMVIPAPPIADLSRATIALVTSGGLIRKGNPDGQVSSNASRYFRHDVAELEALSPEGWEAYHAGYFNHIVNSNPNYILPLSFMREFVAEGRVGSVHPHIYALPGVGTPVAVGKRLGQEIARDLLEAKVGGAIMVST